MLIAGSPIPRYKLNPLATLLHLLLPYLTPPTVFWCPCVLVFWCPSLGVLVLCFVVLLFSGHIFLVSYLYVLVFWWCSFVFVSLCHLVLVSWCFVVQYEHFSCSLRWQMVINLRKIGKRTKAHLFYPLLHFYSMWGRDLFCPANQQFNNFQM